MQRIGSFSLHNSGGFVAHVSVKLVNSEGELQSAKQSGGIWNDGKRHYFDPNDYGVADGSVVYLDVVVDSGDNCYATEPFIYERGNVNPANYRVSGTVKDSSLKFQGVG